MIHIKIEGVSHQVPKNMTILEAARRCGYEIPSLCAYNHGECSRGSCRVCLVEVKGARGLVASCVHPVSEGMEVTISSPRALRARRASVELLLSDHSRDCQQGVKNGECELLFAAKLTGARERKFQGRKSPEIFDALNPSLVRDSGKCILCGRCVARCMNAHGNGVLGFEGRGFNTVVGPAGNARVADSPCLLCGQCVIVCPTGALMGKREDDQVYRAMEAGKHVIVQTAPAVRAGLGHRLHLLHGVSDERLNVLYHKAEAFVYPSVYEGFGIPIIEAISSGLPVVACTGSCLEEAGGPDSLYVAPDDVEGMAAALRQVLRGAAGREQRLERSREYIRRFEGADVAGQVADLYHRLL